MLTRPTHFRFAQDAGGFTLIETLVAMVTGLVVAGALFAILEVALHQSSRTLDSVQATQLGRSAMTHIVDELHSACLAPGFAPIQEGSNSKELIFVNAYSSAAEIPSASEHKITFEKGILTDYAYSSTGASAWPTFAFETAKPSSKTRIGENIEQVPVEGGEAEPVFQYFKYATASNGGEEEVAGKKVAVALGALLPIKEPLTSAKAKEAASVLVSFRALPVSASKQVGRRVAFSTQVTFAFSAPGSESTIKDSPCL